MAGVCKAVSEKEVKCSPHKFYELIKESLHDLPAIFPEGYTDGQILEGDGKSEGSLRLWKYLLPGSTEEMTVKARTAKQDDVNMIIVLYVEEGDVHDHYKHFSVTIQVSPKGGGSLVKWTVEFEKHHGEIPDPHHYLDLFNTLTEKVDAHIHKA
ncbi:hypothetical protein IFM89_016933 [Coptis chinensis]|uniref:Bet v I/Major latex protein domain-containing protein n=1 Tax=Coptis chinensis TaxID=261450 RepID=A0A835H4W8_9MAGN|nr:hypothetical protein IFM89_016933 [Coptis chinensis]